MRFTRRECLKEVGRGALVIAAGSTKALARAARAKSKSEPSHLGMPGLYKGRVVAVQDPGVLVSGHYQAVSQQNEKFLFQQSRKFLFETGKLAG